MVVETMWPEYAPWWLNLFIWMATFWWYILIGFVPAFYVAVVKLFGMPLLQRWGNEVVIVLYPNKAVFKKVSEQLDTYFRVGKGVYWYSQPLQPDSYSCISPKFEEKLEKNRIKYEELMKKETRTKKEELLVKRLLRQQKYMQKQVLHTEPRNQLQIYTHPINQAIYDMKRRETKIPEILHGNATPTKLKGHGVWIMQNPKLHFHRHYQIITNPDGTLYKLIPVKNRQQFGIGFWHSIGILMQKEVQVEQPKEIEHSSASDGGRQLVATEITTKVITQYMKEVQDYPNFSASAVFRVLKKRESLERKFKWDISGQTNPIIWLVLAGAIGAIVVMFLFLHGGGGTTPTAPTTGGRIL